MKQKCLSNEIIEPNENDLDSSLLLSQLLLSQVSPKEEEKVEQKLQQIPKDQYLCPKCLIPHEIKYINEEKKEIEILCANKCQAKYGIKEYLAHICRISYYYYKCEICKKKIQKNFKIEEGNIFKYCFECNKIICLQCFDFTHQKLNHNNIVPSNEIFNKCSIHSNEDFIQFCINCSSHLCSKCTLSPHKGHTLITLNSILPTQKEINKFKKKKEEYIKKKNELLKQIDDLDNLIYLNDIVLQTYLKHQRNYYYIINILNLYNNDINNNGIMNNNINIDDENDDQDYINRSNTADKKVRNKYTKRKLKSDYEVDSKDSSIVSQKINSYNINNDSKINLVNNYEKSKQYKKMLKEILVNIVKNKERKEKSFEKEDRKDWFAINKKNGNQIMDNKKYVGDNAKEEKEIKKFSHRRVRNCSQDIKSNLDLEKGNQYIEKFNKEFGKNPFLDKRKVELWGTKMGKEGLLVLLNNKHKFIEIEELIIGRVKLNSLDFLENLFLDKLKVLNLEYNRISNINIFQNLLLKNLENLKLSSNCITSIDILNKCYFPNLQNLYLSRNSINSIEILSRVNFQKLKGLYLSENKISNISILNKASFFYLSELYLNSNLISSIDVFKEVNFPNLKILNLSCNKIVSIDSLAKITCLKLEEINLRMNMIINVEPLSKANLLFLKELHLDNNNISDVSCFSKTNLKYLQRLYLNNNFISNIQNFKNNPFPRLDTLPLEGNKINNNYENNKKIIEDLEKKKIYTGF